MTYPEFKRGDQIIHVSCGRGVVIGVRSRGGQQKEVTVRLGPMSVIKTSPGSLKLAWLEDLDKLHRDVIEGLKARDIAAELHHSGGGIFGVMLVTPSGETELFGTFRQDFTNVLCYDVYEEGGDWVFSIENDRVKLPASAEDIVTGTIQLSERLK